MNRNSRRGARLIAGMLIGAGLAVGPVTVATAQRVYKRDKTVTWDIGRQGGFIEHGPTSGSVEHLTHAFADDQHFDQVVPVGDHGELKAFPHKLVYQISNNGDKWGGTPLRKTYHWTPPEFFDQGNLGGQLAPPVPPWNPAKQASRHASADASASFLAMRAGAVATMRMHVEGIAKANALQPEDPDGETDVANAASGVRADFKGTITAPAWIAQPRQGKFSVTSPVELWGVAQADGSGGGSATDGDPVALSFYDTAFAEPLLLGSSTIYEDTFSVSGHASIEWDPLDDIVITAGVGGSAAISIATPSEWVLNPLDASCFIANGVFSAYGLFAGLPWDVTSGGGVVSARLPMAAVPHNFEFIYDVSSLPGSMGDVLAVLSAESSPGYAEDWNTVTPTPSTLTLLTMAGLVAVRRRRA
ncbi:MAG: hypothetical protein IT436_07800 [Phycisphaerales bacterium]|nr:hypothetical protein [Phycisphaerales bacterium]